VLLTKIKNVKITLNTSERQRATLSTNKKKKTNKLNTCQRLIMKIH
jgi:hypothetical protein